MRISGKLQKKQQLWGAFPAVRAENHMHVGWCGVYLV